MKNKIFKTVSAADVISAAIKYAASQVDDTGKELHWVIETEEPGQLKITFSDSIKILEN
jgi:hypothetical protein